MEKDAGKRTRGPRGTITMPPPNQKQKLFMLDKTRHVMFGGARGGGKSWALRWKAVLLANRYEGIKILVIRRSYPELVANHINPLKQLLNGIAK